MHDDTEKLAAEHVETWREFGQRGWFRATSGSSSAPRQLI